MYSDTYNPFDYAWNIDLGVKHWIKRDYSGISGISSCTVRKIIPSNIKHCFFHPDCKFPEDCVEDNYFIHKTNTHGQIEDTYHTSYLEGSFSELIFICEL